MPPLTATVGPAELQDPVLQLALQTLSRDDAPTGYFAEVLRSANPGSLAKALLHHFEDQKGTLGRLQGVITADPVLLETVRLQLTGMVRVSPEESVRLASLHQHLMPGRDRDPILPMLVHVLTTTGDLETQCRAAELVHGFHPVPEERELLAPLRRVLNFLLHAAPENAWKAHEAARQLLVFLLEAPRPPPPPEAVKRTAGRGPVRPGARSGPDARSARSGHDLFEVPRKPAHKGRDHRARSHPPPKPPRQS